MSQHPSLRSKGMGLKFRSVLKRFEKLRHLIEKEKWYDEMSIFGLPKVKMIRFKIKKEKAAAETAAAGSETAAEGAAPAAAETKKPEAAKETKAGEKPKAAGGGKKEGR